MKKETLQHLAVAGVINKSGKILQFRDDEYQLVSMTTSFIVDFNKFKQIHFS